MAIPFSLMQGADNIVCRAEWQDGLDVAVEPVGIELLSAKFCYGMQASILYGPGATASCCKKQ